MAHSGLASTCITLTMLACLAAAPLTCPMSEQGRCPRCWLPDKTALIPSGLRPASPPCLHTPYAGCLQAQHIIQRYKSHTVAIVLLLAAVQIGMFVLMDRLIHLQISILSDLRNIGKPAQ